jgi:hypothetical protein
MDGPPPPPPPPYDAVLARQKGSYVSCGRDLGVRRGDDGFLAKALRWFLVIDKI